MVRKSFTAVIEKNTTFDCDFATEPYETGWASEARWFVRVLDLSGEGAALTVHPQISPAGLFWCDEGSAPLLIEDAGLYSTALRDFGGWLRLRGVLTGVESRFRVLIYLALKE
jgi:hypothetical protein